MRRRITLTVDEFFLEHLESSQLRKAGIKRSRAIEYYAYLGLDVGKRVEIAMPQLIQDMAEQSLRLRKQQSSVASPRSAQAKEEGKP